MIDSNFKRKFSMSMYKNMYIKLAEMTFFKDFVNTENGDLYPIIEKSNTAVETVKDNQYHLEKGQVKRVFCQFFPYGTYEFTAEQNEGTIGFVFRCPKYEATILTQGCKLKYISAQNSYDKTLPECWNLEKTFIVSCRPGAFDIYFKKNGKPEYFCTFEEAAFRDSNQYSEFSNSYVLLSLEGKVTVKSVLAYIDNGISIADIRPIKYENGEIMFEQGKLYFSASVRLQEGCFQGVFSWIPGTAEFAFTGAMFYDCGDDRWRGYVAPVILYHRKEKQWYLWVSSFAHKHILAYAAFDGDPRFGVNVIDVTFMPEASETSSAFDFVGFRGDEDPDFFYDEEKGIWYMAICRLLPETGNYTYVFFESLNPFEGYKYIGKGFDGTETGGSFVKIKGERYFICGNNFSARSEYRIYGHNEMKTARFNFPDGGFRGWGTVIPVTMGSRTRFYWLTFDRHNGSDYRWSYGNLYCFEL